MLVLVTDGVTEARSGRRLLGEDGLTKMLWGLREVPVADLPRQLLDSVIDFTGGRLRDDVVILCLARTAPGEK
jgi:serine phosphatase RsbU (regulator of sigma subunit)